MGRQATSGWVIADRYPKRAILMLTQALMGGLAAILGILALTGAARIWHGNRGRGNHAGPPPRHASPSVPPAHRAAPDSRLI